MQHGAELGDGGQAQRSLDGRRAVCQGSVLAVFGSGSHARTLQNLGNERRFDCHVVRVCVFETEKKYNIDRYKDNASQLTTSG